MSTSQNFHDLFRNPGILDQLNLLLALAESQHLTSDLTLALINIVRAELEQPQKQSSSAYRRYSEVTNCLDRQVPEIYEQVVHAWRQRRWEALPFDNPLRSLIEGLLKAASQRGSSGDVPESTQTKPAAEGKMPALEGGEL